jgi:zinc transporter ZupT
MKWKVRLKLLAIIVLLFIIGILSGQAIHNIFLRLIFNFVSGGVLGIGVAKMLTGASWKEIREAWRFWRR